MSATFSSLLKEVRDCQICSSYLRVKPKPIVQLNPQAKLLVIAQAPGKRASASGLPFDDASGDKLRLWLRVSREVFYDETKMAFMAMGFCYPGTKDGGDLPPCQECAPIWHPQIMPFMSKVELTLLIGSYAQKFYLNKGSVTSMVKGWRDHLPQFIPLPHPSWHNNAWIMKNPWFEAELLPYVRERVGTMFNTPS